MINQLLDFNTDLFLEWMYFTNKRTNLYLEQTVHVQFSIGTILGRFDQSTVGFKYRSIFRMDVFDKQNNLSIFGIDCSHAVLNWYYSRKF